MSTSVGTMDVYAGWCASEGLANFANRLLCIVTGRERALSLYIFEEHMYCMFNFTLNPVPKCERVVGNNGITFQQRLREASRPRRPKQRPSLPVEARGRTRVVGSPGRQIGTEDGSTLLAVRGSQVDSSVNKDRQLAMAEAAAGDLFIQCSPAAS